MGRRTKAQISFDNYAAGVAEYKWFTIDISDNNRILVGYEYKDDCKQDQIDNDMKDYTKVVSRRTAMKLYNLEEVLKNWIGIRPTNELN